MKSVVTLMVLLFAGCGHVIPGTLTGGDPFDFAVEHECQSANDPGKARVIYLGSGGVYIAWGNDAILIEPSFSNHGLLRAGFGLATFDRRRIANRLRLIDTSKVRAILAGHSHYDHIGDVPELGLNLPVWVNQSGANMLEPYDMDVHAIVPGEWIPAATSIRVKAVESGHAPQALPGQPLAVRVRRRRGAGAVEAQVAVAFPSAVSRRRDVRIRDRAAGRGDDALSHLLQRCRRALTARPGGRRVRPGHPHHRALELGPRLPGPTAAALRPRHVLVSHWDNFLRKDEKTAKFIPTMRKRDLVRFLGIVSEQVEHDNAGPSDVVCGVGTRKWTMPVIGSSLLFERKPPPDELGRERLHK